MNGPGWLRTALLALALVAFVFLLRQAFSWLQRARVNRAWRRVARETGLALRPLGRSRLPRLEGTWRHRPCRIAALREDGPRGRIRTHVRVALRAPSGVRLELGRSGPLSLLGDLALSRFRGTEDPKEPVAEGDRDAVRGLVTGPLQDLMGAFEDWRLVVDEEGVEILTPGISDDADRLRERLDRACSAAAYLDERSR